jgi:hypothetical protein
MRRMSRSILALPAAAAALSVACTDLSSFSTAKNESYCGSVTAGSEFRTGFEANAKMRLLLDAERLDGPGTAGTLSTVERGVAGGSARRLFDDAKLELFEPLGHDALSRLEFGESRERNAIFRVSPADAEEDAMLAIVSLRADDSVEVRLLRPGRSDPKRPGEKPVFAIFSLTKKAGTCGF